MIQKVAVFWFRRDLRLNDNHGFYKALKSGLPVLPVFIFDTNILKELPAKDDARLSFIYAEIQKLKKALEENGSSLHVFHGKPKDAFTGLIKDFEIEHVFLNKDYEPYGIQRDKEISKFLADKNIGFHSFKDHVIFEEEEVVKDDGKPYTVYTPFSRKWKKLLEQTEIPTFESENQLDNLFEITPISLPGLEKLGFKKSELSFPSSHISRDIIQNYAELRDVPGVRGTSRLGIHLRFGTISIRELVKVAKELSEVFLNELIWREFYMAILWHFPRLVAESFKTQYDFIQWRNDEKEFDKWCRGETGYPMVDAGMREMNETGFMHNRVRMVVASFLTKHLLIDWRWGEAYFAEKLLDFELASNNGNWQWAAGCGCDAAPYFRIFNPEAQQQKFDPEFKYIKKWVPEFDSADYIQPMVDHKLARARAMNAYKAAVKDEL
ncbi:MAG TPA: deoxyribodipyrimidine photo-lyase [Prolixibacteraceae bacterium]|nr:deoxyribodipyrimidine photo-lyase [Prolixibacteraceae bacterium]